MTISLHQGSVTAVALLAGLMLLPGCKQPVKQNAANELAAIGNAVNALDAPANAAAATPPDPQVQAAARVLPAIAGYVPAQLAPLPDGRLALIGTIEKEGAAHVETGWLAVHYLDHAGGAYKLVGSWPQTAAGNGFGAGPSTWRVTGRLADNPTVESEAGYGNQGSFCTWINLTELTPDGPTTSEAVLSGYDDSGAQEGRGQATTLTGIITNIVKNQSFDMTFNGTRRFTDHYVRRGGKWVVQGGHSGLEQCRG